MDSIACISSQVAQDEVAKGHDSRLKRSPELQFNWQTGERSFSA